MVVADIQALLEKHGIKQKVLAAAIGIGEDAMTRLLKGKRALKAVEQAKIEEFFATYEPLTAPISDLEVEYVRVIGEVAAGAFNDMTYVDFADYEIPYVVDPRWPRDGVKALLVRGESINRQARDGDHVVVLLAEFAPRTWRAGDWVVAECKKGGLVETTVKRVRGSAANGWELWPDSDDERFKDPIKLDDCDDAQCESQDRASVRVIAFVLDFLRAGVRF